MRQRISTLSQLARPEAIRHSKLALLPVPSKLQPSCDKESDNPFKKLRTNTILLPAVVTTSTDKGRNDTTINVNLENPLSFPTEDADVEFTTKPTLKIGVRFGRTVGEMHTLVVVDNRAGINHIHSALIATEWLNCAKKESLPRLRSETKKKFLSKGLLILYLRLGDLCTGALFCITPQIAASMLVRTDFKNRFIRNIFSSEEKVVPWHSLSIAIQTYLKPGQNVTSLQETQNNPEEHARKVEKTSIIRVTRRIVSKPRTQNYEIVNNKA